MIQNSNILSSSPLFFLIILDAIINLSSAIQVNVSIIDIKRDDQISYYCQEGNCESPDIKEKDHKEKAVVVFGGVPTNIKVIGILKIGFNSSLASLDLESEIKLYGSFIKLAFANTGYPAGTVCDEYKATEAYFAQPILIQTQEVDIKQKKDGQIFYGLVAFEAYINVSLPLLSKKDSFYHLCVKQNLAPNLDRIVTVNNGSLIFDTNNKPGSTYWVFTDPKLRVRTLRYRSRYLLPYIGLQIGIVVAMFLISGLFSGLTIGLLSLDPTELTLVLKSGTPKERQCAKVIVPLRRRGNFLLCSLVLGNVLVNAALTLLLENLSSGTIAVVVSTLGITIFGEILPQAICTRHGLEIGAKTVWITKFFMFVTAPLSLPLSWCLDWLLGQELGSVYDRQRLVELVKMMAGSTNPTKSSTNNFFLNPKHGSSLSNFNSNSITTNIPSPPGGNAKGVVYGAERMELQNSHGPAATTNNAAVVKMRMMNRIRRALFRRSPSPDPKRTTSARPYTHDKTAAYHEQQRSSWNCPLTSTSYSVSHGPKSQVLRQDEADIITGALDMVSKTVREVMTPLEHVFAIGHDSILDFTTMAAIVNSGFTRIPVYHEPDRSDVVGLLNFKDLAFVDPDDRVPLRTLLRFYNHVVTYVFEDTPLCSILEEFKKGESHMAFVRRVVTEDDKDPWYEIVGLVTLEDVIEEIIQSEIWDETDKMVDGYNKRTEKRRKNHGFSLFWKPNSSNDSASSRLTPQMALVAFQFLKANIEAFKEDRVSSRILRKLLRRPSVVVVTGEERSQLHQPIDSDDSSCLKMGDIDSTIATKDGEEYSKDSNQLQPVPCAGKRFQKTSFKPNHLYTKGKPANYFVLILEGKIRVYAGQEDICFDSGPFNYFGLQALALHTASQANLPTGSSNLKIESFGKYVEQPFFIPDYTVIPITDRLIYLKIRADHYEAVVKATYIERERLKDQNIADYKESAATGLNVAESCMNGHPRQATPHKDLLTVESNMLENKMAKRERMITDFLSPTPRPSPKISRCDGLHLPSHLESEGPLVASQHSNSTNNTVPSLMNSQDVRTL